MLPTLGLPAISAPSEGATSIASNASGGLANLFQSLAPQGAGATSNPLAALVAGKSLPVDFDAQVAQLLQNQESPEQALQALAQLIDSLPNQPAVKTPMVALESESVKTPAELLPAVQIELQSGEILTLDAQTLPADPIELKDHLTQVGVPEAEIPDVLEQIEVTLATIQQLTPRVADATPEITAPVVPRPATTGVPTAATSSPEPGQAQAPATVAPPRPVFDVNQLRDALSRAAKQLQPVDEPKALNVTTIKSVSALPVTAPAQDAPDLPITFNQTESRIDLQIRSVSERVAPAPTTQPPAPVPSLPVELTSNEWLDKLAQRASMAQRDGLTEMRVRLDPSHLGHIELKLSQQGDQTQVQLLATDARVREALDAGAMRLRDALSQAGVELSQFDVSDQRREHEQSTSERTPQAEGIDETADELPMDIVQTPATSQRLVDQRV